MVETDPKQGEGAGNTAKDDKADPGKVGGDPKKDPEPKAKEIPEDLKDLVSSMIVKEVGKVTAKSKAQIETRDAEIAKLKLAALPDEEKIKAAQTEKDNLIKSQADKIASFEAREKKLAAIEKAKLVLPKDVSISDLLELMPANDDDSIAKYIAIFKKTYVAPKGIGSGMQGGSEDAPATEDDQIQAALAEAQKTGNWTVYNKLCVEKQNRMTRV